MRIMLAYLGRLMPYLIMQKLTSLPLKTVLDKLTRPPAEGSSDTAV